MTTFIHKCTRCDEDVYSKTSPFRTGFVKGRCKCGAKYKFIMVS